MKLSRDYEKEAFDAEDSTTLMHLLENITREILEQRQRWNKVIGEDLNNAEIIADNIKTRLMWINSK